MQKSLADITPEDLEEITRLAGLFQTPREVSKGLELDEDEIARICAMKPCQAAEYKVYSAYWAGWLQSEVDLRENIKKMSDAGSVPAKAMMFEIMKLSKIKLYDR